MEDAIAESLLKDEISIGDNLYLHSEEMYIKGGVYDTRINLILKGSDEALQLERT